MVVARIPLLLLIISVPAFIAVKGVDVLNHMQVLP